MAPQNLSMFPPPPEGAPLGPYSKGDLIQGVADRGPDGPFSLQGKVLEDDDPYGSSPSSHVRVRVSNIYLMQPQAGGRWYDVSHEKRVAQVLRTHMMRIEWEEVGVVGGGQFHLW
ncbi:hypothetical protein RB594_007840 [Gaeumannomyces avenae]